MTGTLRRVCDQREGPIGRDLVERTIADLPMAERDGRSAITLPERDITLRGISSSSTEIHVTMIHSLPHRVEIYTAINHRQDLVEMLTGPEPRLVAAADAAFRHMITTLDLGSDPDHQASAIALWNQMRAIGHSILLLAMRHQKWHGKDRIQVASSDGGISVEMIESRDNLPRVRALEFGYPEISVQGLDLADEARRMCLGLPPLLNCTVAQDVMEKSSVVRYHASQMRFQCVPSDLNRISPTELARHVRLANLGEPA